MVLVTLITACAAPNSEVTVDDMAKQIPTQASTQRSTKKEPTKNWCAELEKMSFVLTDERGQKLEIEDLVNYDGNISYELQTPNWILPEAQELFDQGRVYALETRFEDAIASFEQAAELDPSWPYPIYEMALTYLLMGDADKALQLYQQVDEMAPEGFFTAKVAIDVLRRERDGVVEEGSYIAILYLENLKDREVRQATVKALLEKSEELPRAWQVFANSIEDPEARLEALNRGLSYDPDPQTKAMLLINKAMALGNLNREEEAYELFTEVAESKSTPMGPRYQALLALCLLELNE